MEYNKNTSLKLLEHLPASLTESNLENIQSIIDSDKYERSTLLGSDLCGTYAPFCHLCDKSIHNPCAVAYIKMKMSTAVQRETAVSDDEQTIEKKTVKVEEQTPANVTAPQKRRIRIAVAKCKR